MTQELRDDEDDGALEDAGIQEGGAVALM